ncbi:MAG: YdcF family protein, partial [Pedobacter sp.]
MLLLLTNPFIINELYRFWEIKKQSEKHKIYEAGIILSGFMKKDDTYNSLSFGNATDRLTEGLMLYKNGIIKRIIISGGSGSLIDNTRESVLAKDFLVKYCAVPDSAVLIDTVSRNTYENAVESKKIVESKGVKSLIIITSA